MAEEKAPYDQVQADVDCVIKMRLEYSFEHGKDESYEEVKARANEILNGILGALDCEWHIHDVNMNVTHDKWNKWRPKKLSDGR